jgi:rhodanese-related sulfurtransferase
MMTETIDTLGHQKKVNYALRRDMTKDEFIAEVTAGLLPPPAYFPMNVKMNKEGYESIDAIMRHGLKALDPVAFELEAETNEALVLDVRSKDDFRKGFIPRSIFIGLDDDFAPWVGALIKDVYTPILLVAPEGREEEAITRLARVGFDNTLGYLAGGLEAWQSSGKEIDVLDSISADAFSRKVMDSSDDLYIFDVRKASEYQEEHLRDAANTPLDFINDHLAEFPTNKTFYVHCKGGYRSAISSSILKSRGYHNVIDIMGGFDAMKGTALGQSKYLLSSANANS